MCSQTLSQANFSPPHLFRIPSSVLLDLGKNGRFCVTSSVRNLQSHKPAVLTLVKAAVFLLWLLDLPQLKQSRIIYYYRKSRTDLVIHSLTYTLPHASTSTDMLFGSHYPLLTSGYTRNSIDKDLEGDLKTHTYPHRVHRTFSHSRHGIRSNGGIGLPPSLQFSTDRYIPFAKLANHIADAFQLALPKETQLRSRPLGSSSTSSSQRSLNNPHELRNWV